MYEYIFCLQPYLLLYHAGPPKVVQVAVPVTQKPYVVQVSWIPT